MLCSNFIKFGRQEINEIVHYLLHKKTNIISPASQTVTTVQIDPKICYGQPPTMYSECSRFHPNEFTFGRVIAKRVSTAKSRPKVNPIFDGASSQIASIIYRLPRQSVRCSKATFNLLLKLYPYAAYAAVFAAVAAASSAATRDR